MTEYAFYKIELCKPAQTILTPEHDISVEQAQKFFGPIFEKRCTIDSTFKKNKNGDKTKLANTILENRDGIIIWRIHNEQVMDMVKPSGKVTNGIPEYIVKTETSNPYSHVIIDNRPGKLFLAIEKSSAWKNKTKKVKEIIIDSLSEYLQIKFNLDINILELTIPTKIWDFCETRCKNGNDSIKKITFNIKNPTLVDPSSRPTPDSFPEMLKGFQEFAKLTGALKTVFSTTYKNASPSQLQEKANDFVNLVRTCTQREYELQMEFNNYGVYKCDDQVIAEFPLSDNEINQFLSITNGNLWEENPIGSWFDNCVKELDRIRDANKTPESRDRKH